ncbi:hypothetical protein BH23PSE1_BH23PSE1_03310 [soil metagenome]
MTKTQSKPDVGGAPAAAAPAPRRSLRRRITRPIWLALRYVLGEGQYIVLHTWFRIMGPPRVLVYRHEINARLLRAFGARIGQNVMMSAPITLHNAPHGFANLSIAEDCVMNGGAFLDLKCPITLERGVSLGPNVIIMTHNAFNKNPFLEARLPRLVGEKPVLIGRGAGIKAAAVILHGVTIGEEALVAGGSFVSRNVPRRAYVSGVPAVVRRNLDEGGEGGRAPAQPG